MIDTAHILYGTSFLLIAIGIYGLLAMKNLIKMIVSLNVADVGVNLLLVTAGYVDGGIAPIYRAVGTEAATLADQASRMVDPVPQALVLTAIVIGFGVTALALTMTMRVYSQRGTIDTGQLRGLKW